MNRDDDIAATGEKEFFSGGIFLLQNIQQWSKYCAGIAVIIAFLVLTGWQFDIEFLKRPFRHPATMSLAIAFSFIFPAFPFYLLYLKTGEAKNSNNFISLKINWANRQ